MIPVYQDYSLNHAIKKLDLNGREMTIRMKKLLQEAGVYFTTKKEFEIIRKVKEKRCYVALDYVEEMAVF